MCLLLFDINPSASEKEIYFILINTRDEIYDRPTERAKFWNKYPHVIGGMDLEPGKAGGTWLAMSRSGKIGVLLNILQPDEDIQMGKKGRGFLVVDYVTSSKDCSRYLEDLKVNGSSYNEFCLVTLDCSSLKVPKMAFYSNSTSSPPTQLDIGTHGFGNSISFDAPWPKVTKAKEKFVDIIKRHSSVSSKDILVEELFALLQDSTKYPLDENMKKQGKNKPQSFLKKLSAVFVNIPEANYGSRCHTVIVVDGAGHVDYYERSRPEEATAEVSDQWLRSHTTFTLQCN